MANIINVNVAVIGGGPAGLAAAIAAAKEGRQVLLVEREARLGGILKQCIHDGFGVIRFGKRLSGPEYAEIYIEDLRKTNVQVQVLTFVTSVQALENGGFSLSLVGRNGLSEVHCDSLVLATGCRERTAKQISIHGTRPAGVFTAGCAQHYTNILGQLPARRCVILGSGDIGLIMARRLTLEGAEVLGVYEAKQSPSGLSRNIAQCLHDFDIPLHLSHTVTKVFGHERLEAVEVCKVDENMCPIAGSEERIACDGLILSVGLIPENELAESLNVPLSPLTKGPLCDQDYQTKIDGIFCCGNALHVNDLVDYVSESGHTAGRKAALYAPRSHPRNTINVECDDGILYVVPQMIDLDKLGADNEVVLFFRSESERKKTTLQVLSGDSVLLQKTYAQLRPPEMERLSFRLSPQQLTKGQPLRLLLSEVSL